MSLDELVAQQRQQARPSHLNCGIDSKGAVPAYTCKCIPLMESFECGLADHFTAAGVPPQLVVAEHIIPERKAEENKEAVDAA